MIEWRASRDDSPARFGTMPVSTGRARTPTMGIVVVAAFKSRTRGVLDWLLQAH